MNNSPPNSLMLIVTLKLSWIDIKALEDQATPALVDLRVMKDLMWVTVFYYFAGLAKTKRKRVSCTAGGFFTN